MVNFDITPVTSSIIMVIGVGGGGSNAVNHMYRMGITDVSFMVCNTDRQALERSPIPAKIRLGETLTGGLGAGNKPERGRQAALESIEEIKAELVDKNIKMVFVTAGMGGGTGTGAAPVIAKAAKEMGILTVAIVTIPFKTEGPKRIEQAIAGIEEISHNVDSLLVINNANIREIYGDLTLPDAFGKADDILATAAKGIAEIITNEFTVNVDFEDVSTVMRDSGIALMASARGAGETRALDVVQRAMSSPLLNHNDIAGARNILLNITWGNKAATMDETYEIQQFVQNKASGGNGADIIWGAGADDTLEDDLRVTIIATGFGVESIPALKEYYKGVIPNAAKPIIEPIKPVSLRQVVHFDEPEQTVSKPKRVIEGDDDFTVVDRNDFTETTSTVELEIQQQQQTVLQAVSVQVPLPAVDQVVEDAQSIFTLTDDELDDIPAWKRRQIRLESRPYSGSTKVVRENLSSEVSSSDQSQTSNSFKLFDE